MPPEAGAIRPTLFIGLGGTGKEVLLRLRRRFYERWRQVGLPCVRYLWIDTDTRFAMAQNEKLDEIDSLLMFKEFESIGLLSRSVGEDLGEVLREKNRYRYIHDWLPEEVDTYGAQVADGAGGVRSIGRLSLIRHFSRVRNSIRAKLEEITTDANTRETTEVYLPGVQLDDAAPQVYVIFSIAGGTGGGTFLDIAFLLRQMRLLDTVGIAVLPNVYHDSISMEGKRSLANGYSAAKELEHFTRRLKQNQGVDGNAVSPDFQVKWEDSSRPVSISGPPFAVMYLCEKIDDRNSAQERHPLFHMIAESLFVNFLPGQFSSQRRSDLSNVRQHLAGALGDSVHIDRKGVDKPIPLTQVFSRRYASLGMSKIEVPTESIREACAANLAADILDYWYRPAMDRNLPRRVEDSSKGAFDLDGIEKLFGPEHEAEMEGRLKTMLPASMKFRGSVDEVAAQLEVVERNLQDAMADLFEKSGQDSARWGRIKYLLHFSVKPCAQKLHQNILDWCGKQLDVPEAGLAALVENTPDAKGMLLLLQSNLEKIYRPNVRIAGQPAQPGLAQQRVTECTEQAEYWAGEQNRIMREMSHVNRSLSVRALAVRGWTLERLWKELEEVTSQHWKWRGAAILSEEAAAVAESSEQPLKLLIGRLTDFRNALPPNRELMTTLQREYLDFSKGVRSIRIFEPADDYPRFYRLGFDEQRKEHLAISPGTESRNFSNKMIRRGGSTMEIIDAHANGGIDLLIQKLRDFTSTRFREDFAGCLNHDCPRIVEVLTHPRAGSPEKVARQLVDSAATTLRVDLDPHEMQSHSYLSVPENTSPEYVKFIEMVSSLCQERGYGKPAVFATGDRSRIQMLVEKYVFPLNRVPGIVDDCEPQYSNFYRYGFEGQMKQFRIPLHINKQWEGEFEDLRMIASSDADAHLSAIEVLALGPILGVVRAHIEGERRRYSYSKWIAPTSQDEPLGNRRLAIDTLVGDAALLNDLMKELRMRHQQKVSYASSAVPEEKAQAIDYAWALAYVRFADLMEGTPERAIADALATELSGLLGANGPIVNDSQKVLEEASAALKNKVEWSGGFPILDPSRQFVRGQPLYARK